MLKPSRTDSTNKDFISLVKLLDEELARRDGKEHAFYAQFNTIAALKYVVVVYQDNKPVACGGLKQFDEHSLEIKRMFVVPECRAQGVGGLVLSELEKWAIELGFERCILETGKRQPEAIALYKKHGYTSIANYGQYAGIENSLCFEKLLR